MYTESKCCYEKIANQAGGLLRRTIFVIAYAIIEKTRISKYQLRFTYVYKRTKDNYLNFFF